MSECEECAYAIWDNWDSSVGLSAYVEFCKIQSSSIERMFDECDDTHICSFFIKQLTPEICMIRCPECKSRHVKWKSYIEYYTSEYKCDDCGIIFKSEDGYML